MTHRFVDLMANVDWPEADILNRTEAEIASVFPPTRFAILQRKVMGAQLGAYTLTLEEQAELSEYQLVCYHAGEAANLARADITLLREAWAVENAQDALAALPEPPIEGEDPYAAERAAYQAVIAAADQATLDLVALRNPPEEPPP